MWKATGTSGRAYASAVRGKPTGQSTGEKGRCRPDGESRPDGRSRRRYKGWTATG
ncbi:MAG: hypothetical protein K2P19_03980 [Kineothrix sp.]|nr:hypothetical protein [Kineothrix sp.]